jgi:cell division control protein 45
MQTTNGGSGGVVICLGVGGLVDLAEILGMSQPEEEEVEEDMGGVEIWVFDARRPWNLANVFGGQAGMGQAMAEIDVNARNRGRGVDQGRITPAYTSKNGGIIVFDDGDIQEELGGERDAYYALLEMPEVDDDDESDGDDDEEEVMPTGSKKRKSWSGREDDDDSDEEDGPPRQRKRSNSVWSIVFLYCRTNADTPHRVPRLSHLQVGGERGI